MAKIKKPATKGGKKNAAPKKAAKKKPSKIIASVNETRAGLKRTLTERQIDQFNADKMRAEALAKVTGQLAASVAAAGEFGAAMSKPLHPTVEEQWEQSLVDAKEQGRSWEEQAAADLQRLHDLGIVKAPHLPPLSLRKRASNALSRWRSAITGLFVSKKFAEANPDTTVREKAD